MTYQLKRFSRIVLGIAIRMVNKRQPFIRSLDCFGRSSMPYLKDPVQLLRSFWRPIGVLSSQEVLEQCESLQEESSLPYR